MPVLTTIHRGPEGRQRVAHGVSRGIEGQPEVISAPEGRQRLPSDPCRPSGAVNFPAAWPTTAYESVRELVLDVIPRSSHGSATHPK